MWKFKPIYKTTVWGGRRLRSFKDDPLAPGGAVGESWELSDIPGSESVVEAGPDKGLSLRTLIEKYGAALLGAKGVEKGGLSRFPLLLKFIDAAADLSVQVHPDDAMARRMGRPFGKNEMWVVVDSEPGSRLACGFNRPVDSAALPRLAADGGIVDTLRYTEVKAGDSFYIPAGRVHAIGAGMMIAEIQQSSDDTFRLYDYGRPGPDGRPRELHIAEATQATDTADTAGAPVVPERIDDVEEVLVRSPFFTVSRLTSAEPVRRSYKAIPSFVAFMCMEGEAKLTSYAGNAVLRRGETILLGADEKELLVMPEGDGPVSLLEIHL